MNILQIHSEYSTSKISGENSTVHQLSEIFSSFGEATLYSPSTKTLQESQIAKFSAVKRYLSTDQSIVQMAKQYDLVILHNTIPIVSASSVREIASLTKVVRVWHNFRNSCISGNHFRKVEICLKCSDSPFKKLSGIIHSCYRDSRVQSSIVTKAEHQYSQLYHENILWHVGISNFMKKYIENLGVDESKIRVIPNSIQPMAFIGKPHGSDFLMMGRIEVEKGFVQAVQAWQLLPYSVKGGRKFHIVGDGSLLKVLRKLAISEDIIFHGVLSPVEISELASTCSVGIATSLWNEPFGKIAAEYLSHGLITIATPRGGLIEIVKDAPGGIITRDTTKESIASAMLEALSLGTQDKFEIRQFFLRNYTEGKIASKWLELFAEILHE